MSYKGGFYSQEDLEEIYSAIDAANEFYQEHKHEFELSQVVDARENMAILNTQLSDIEADLYGVKLKREAEYDDAKDKAFLRIRKELLDKGYDGKKVGITSAEEIAKKLSNIETYELLVLLNEAKAMHKKASGKCYVTIPKQLDAMSSRCNTLNRLMPTKPEENDTDTKGMRVQRTEDTFSRRMRDVEIGEITEQEDDWNLPI